MAKKSWLELRVKKILVEVEGEKNSPVIYTRDNKLTNVNAFDSDLD
jgi:hypothetical protein